MWLTVPLTKLMSKQIQYLNTSTMKLGKREGISKCRQSQNIGLITTVKIGKKKKTTKKTNVSTWVSLAIPKNVTSFLSSISSR